MLIVMLALWLVAISLVLRFLSVAGDARCAACGGELELWPESRRCPDCGAAVSAPRRHPVRGRLAWEPDSDAIHELVAGVVHGRLNRSRRSEHGHMPIPPAHYQRASSGSTRSAKSRTLS